MGSGWGCLAAGLLTAGAVRAAADVSSLPKPAYNEPFSLSAEIALTEGGSEGDLLTLTGGGGNASAKDVRKGFRVSLAGSSLTVSAAGKDGNYGAVVTQTVTVPGTVRVALAVDNTASGTDVTVRAAVTGGSAGARTQYNFDNVAHSQGTWAANAPFDTWSVSASVTALEAVTGTAWPDAELEARVAETLPKVTFSGKTATSVTASYPLAFEALEQQAYTADAAWAKAGFMTAEDTADATLFTPEVNVQTTGRWRAVFAAQRTLTFETVTLQVPTYNSAGKPQSADRQVTFRLCRGEETEPLASVTQTLTGAGTLPAGAAANAVTLESVASVTLAAGERLTLVCERAEETLGCYFGLQSLAFGAREPAKAAPGTAELTVPEGASVTWTDAAWVRADGSVGTLPAGVMPVVRWQGGTLTVPAGVSVSAFRCGEGSGTGRLEILGTLAGADDGCPGVAAFDLPAGVTAVLRPGAALQMDGRLPATLEIAAGSAADAPIDLGAATDGETLRLDRLVLPGAAEDVPPVEIRGLIEVYGAQGFGVTDRESAVRWDYDGFRMMLR